MADPIVSADEVRTLNKFPKAEDPEIAAAVVDRTNEVYTHLARKGVIVPLDLDAVGQDTPLATFVGQLQLTVKYGAAAMIEGTSVPGRAPDRQAAIIGSYLDEYKRLLADLDALTDAELAAMGVPMVTQTDLGGVQPPGIRRASRTRCRTVPWWAAEPVRRVGHG